MQIPTTALLFGLVATSIAGPITKVEARQAVTRQAYADFQISDGVSGNALAEVNAKFPVSILSCKMFSTPNTGPDH